MKFVNFKFNTFLDFCNLQCIKSIELHIFVYDILNVKLEMTLIGYCNNEVKL